MSLGHPTDSEAAGPAIFNEADNSLIEMKGRTRERC
jgi:hypothetical protein